MSSSINFEFAQPYVKPYVQPTDPEVSKQEVKKVSSQVNYGKHSYEITTIEQVMAIRKRIRSINENINNPPVLTKISLICTESLE